MLRRGGGRAIVFPLALAAFAFACLLALHARAQRLLGSSPTAAAPLDGGQLAGFGPPRKSGAETPSPAHRPRVTAVGAGEYFGRRRASRNTRPSLDLDAVARNRTRTIATREDEARIARQRLLLDDGYYDKRRRRPDFPPHGGCEPLQPWQMTSFPSCNLLHEVDRTVEAWSQGRHRWTNLGGYNLVFAVNEELPRSGKSRKTDAAASESGNGTSSTDPDPSFALKEIAYPYSDAWDHIFHNVRMDALVMERLTRSPNVVDIYGHCGLTLAVAWGDTQLGQLIFDGKNPTRETKLRLAVHVASALADIENMDGDGVAPYVHMDYMVRQHLLVNGTLQLSDFNKGLFVSSSKKQRAANASLLSGSGGGGAPPCEFGGVGKDGTFRSPEEYRGEALTAKAQVFSLGNILQSILTGKRMWAGMDDDVARGHIQSGRRYGMARSLRRSKNPIDVALRREARRCLARDPHDRPAAMEVAEALRGEAARLGVDLSAT